MILEEKIVIVRNEEYTAKYFCLLDPNKRLCVLKKDYYYEIGAAGDASPAVAWDSTDYFAQIQGLENLKFHEKIEDAIQCFDDFFEND